MNSLTGLFNKLLGENVELEAWKETDLVGYWLYKFKIATEKEDTTFTDRVPRAIMMKVKSFIEVKFNDNREKIKEYIDWYFETDQLDWLTGFNINTLKFG